MKIRTYQLGDEYRLDMNDTMREEWAINGAENENRLRLYESKTIEKDGRPVCVLNSFPTSEGVYVWFIADRNMPAMALRIVKRMLDEYKKEHGMLFTYSASNEKQDKMHRFLGFNELKTKKMWRF